MWDHGDAQQHVVGGFGRLPVARGPRGNVFTHGFQNRCCLLEGVFLAADHSQRAGSGAATAGRSVQCFELFLLGLCCGASRLIHGNG